jgi:hypothetical protein
VSAEEILEVLACPDIEPEPPLDVMLPDHLVPPERLAADLQVRGSNPARNIFFAACPLKAAASTLCQ